MSGNMIPFPQKQEFHVEGEHIFLQGGMSMKVKNTHPEYVSDEARVEQLKDTRKTCLAMIRALRSVAEQSA